MSESVCESDIDVKGYEVVKILKTVHLSLLSADRKLWFALGRIISHAAYHGSYSR